MDKYSIDKVNTIIDIVNTGLNGEHKGRLIATVINEVKLDGYKAGRKAMKDITTGELTYDKKVS